MVDGQRRIISDPPLIVPLEEVFTQSVSEAIFDEFHQLLRKYRHTLQTDPSSPGRGVRGVNVARKVVGVGSVGTRAWILLLQGRDNDDALFSRRKRPRLGAGRFAASEYAHHGNGWWPANI